MSKEDLLCCLLPQYLDTPGPHHELTLKAACAVSVNSSVGLPQSWRLMRVPTWDTCQIVSKAKSTFLIYLKGLADLVKRQRTPAKVLGSLCDKCGTLQRL